MNRETRPLKILYLISEDWYFWSHRLPLAQAARDQGYAVIIATRVSSFGEHIQQQGIKLVPLRTFERKLRNPLKEIAAIAELARIYRCEKPDLVHHVSLKLALYGTLAVYLARVPHCINALAGLGYLFTPSGRTRPPIIKRLLRHIAIIALRILFAWREIRVIVQNPADQDLLLTQHITTKQQTLLIRGSGVNLQAFTPTPEPPGIPVVMLGARLLWDKGIQEFIEAACLLTEQYGNIARFVLVGIPDPENPSSVSETTLRDWTRRYSFVEWWGYHADMPDVFAQIHIACLPSYAEGLPKFLLEAAASGKPIVTTDIPGCREVATPGENGLLVAPRDAKQLADALYKLIIDPVLRSQMGRRSRERAEAEFSQESIVQATLAVYQQALKIPH